MIIHRNIDTFTGKNTVITIGTFDGVHLGHRKVIDTLNEIAQKNSGESLIFTFYPHPRLIFSPNDQSLRLITTLEEKVRKLEEAGVDHLVVYPFTKEFAALGYQEFIETILIGKLKMKTLIVGHDHRLGRNREGTFEKISDLTKRLPFQVAQIETFLVDGVDISSSKIRFALQTGDIPLVNNFLGYTFSLQGKVVEGNMVGRKIGFPTANIEASDPYKIIPEEGVYAVYVELDGILHKAMLNIGYRPTISSNADHRTIEAHIFDFNADIYQKEVNVYFIERIRSEHRFNSLEELKLQLSSDKETVLHILDKAKINK